MKMTKKLITLALAALMLLSLAVPAMADDSDFDIQVMDDEGSYDVVLLGYDGPGGDVVVPAGVTSIASNAFAGNSNLTSVTIPSSVTEIGFQVFFMCENLKSVTIPASVTLIGEATFSLCPNLTDIFFGGTEAQWVDLEKAIVDMDYSDMGLSMGVDPKVTIHYNSTGPDTPTTPETPTTPSFGDVPADAWYAKPVAWAVEKGITNGTSKDTFSPEKTCNTAEILTFLWRACDKPSAPAANLSDVDSGVWYADAASWAKSKGMISGNKLSPDTPCTRASAVMFIWQAMGKPTASKTASFSDVPADSDYAAAVAWAVEKGVTNGTGADTFSPDDICTRGHIVTFLQRAYAE